ncbi:uncharacterized protein MONOS_9704 [Monocercomonoides exilis]|uniref:uncharacterized protein n=1 Tax=Monocercomonoides exilis TaxID=2049356 RepID=UPI00355A7C29|nr:hypothetical protein MONOS_9704 [Monocercomonoides exilis]|eukprot:MONOS_9704.1-p1 / transcript=MONOS_9704.1 / gene=MONOS_9704 / organism=Monocercomonoides_exilis_PA203 / gene_product=unspecified product / transcript_product=unspecified product / location=Mono_scaffold00410:50806-53863(+) / protein_length=918 / sequence_SO=supercontig / SO=protein_coding / is_pseudo=false
MFPKQRYISPSSYRFSAGKLQEISFPCGNKLTRIATFNIPIEIEDFGTVKPQLAIGTFIIPSEKKKDPIESIGIVATKETPKESCEGAFIVCRDMATIVQLPTLEEYHKSLQGFGPTAGYDPVTAMISFSTANEPFLVVGRRSGQFEVISMDGFSSRYIYNEGCICANGAVTSIDYNSNLDPPLIIVGFEDGTVLGTALDLPEIEWPNPSFSSVSSTKPGGSLGHTHIDSSATPSSTPISKLSFRLHSSQTQKRGEQFNPAKHVHSPLASSSSSTSNLTIAPSTSSSSSSSSTSSSPNLPDLVPSPINHPRTEKKLRQYFALVAGNLADPDYPLHLKWKSAKEPQEEIVSPEAFFSKSVPRISFAKTFNTNAFRKNVQVHSPSASSSLSVLRGITRESILIDTQLQHPVHPFFAEIAMADPPPMKKMPLGGADHSQSKVASGALVASGTENEEELRIRRKNEKKQKEKEMKKKKLKGKWKDGVFIAAPSSAATSRETSVSSLASLMAQLRDEERRHIRGRSADDAIRRMSAERALRQEHGSARKSRKHPIERAASSSDRRAGTRRHTSPVTDIKRAEMELQMLTGEMPAEDILPPSAAMPKEPPSEIDISLSVESDHKSVSPTPDAHQYRPSSSPPTESLHLLHSSSTALDDMSTTNQATDVIQEMELNEEERKLREASRKSRSRIRLSREKHPEKSKKQDGVSSTTSKTDTTDMTSSVQQSSGKQSSSSSSSAAGNHQARAQSTFSSSAESSFGTPSTTPSVRSSVTSSTPGTPPSSASAVYFTAAARSPSLSNSATVSSSYSGTASSAGSPTHFFKTTSHLSQAVKDEMKDYPGMSFFTRSQQFNPLCRWSVSKGRVFDIKINPNKKFPLVAFVTEEGFLVVFHYQYNRFKYAFKSPVGALLCCAWSSDGKILAV